MRPAASQQKGPGLATLGIIAACLFGAIVVWQRGNNGASTTAVWVAEAKCPPCAASGACDTPIVQQQRKGWTREIAAHSRQVHSQRGQDGVLEYIFENIGTTNKFFIEFGYNTNELTGASGPNTALLRKNGWSGLLLDGGHENPAINLYAHFLCPSNILSIFELRKVPPNPDYVSVDIDGFDPWLMQEIMRSHKFRPRVISVEFNAAFPRDSPMVIAGWGACERAGRSYGGTRLNSASPGVLARIGAEAGYTLVHVEGDAFFLRSDQLRDDPFELKDLPAAKANDKGCFDATWERKLNKELAAQVWDYDVYVSTGSADKARAAARAMVERAEVKCGFKLAEEGAWDP